MIYLDDAFVTGSEKSTALELIRKAAETRRGSVAVGWDRNSYEISALLDLEPEDIETFLERFQHSGLLTSLPSALLSLNIDLDIMESPSDAAALEMQLKAASSYFGSRGQEFTSDVLLSFALFAELLATSKIPDWDHGLGDLFKRLHSASEWDSLSNDDAWVALLPAAIAPAFAFLPEVSPTDRLLLLDFSVARTEQAVDANSRLLMLGTYALSLRTAAALMRSGVVEGSSNATLEAELVIARRRCDGSLARAILLDDAAERLMVITGLLVLPAIWANLTGDFEESHRAACTARQAAEKAQEVVLAQLESDLREGRLLLDDISSDEDRAELEPLLGRMEAIAKSVSMMADTCELLELEALAELSRRAGDLRAAAQAFDKAAELRLGVLTKMQVMVIALAPALSGMLSGEDSGAGVMIAHQLTATALIARADYAIMQPDPEQSLELLSEAAGHLLEVEAALSERLSQATARSITVGRSPVELSNVGSGLTPQERSTRSIVADSALNRARISQLRAKQNLARGERLAVLRSHFAASREYQSAAVIFGSISSEDLATMPPRVVEAASGAELYAEGCMDCELVLDAIERRSALDVETLQSALERLERAASAFQLAKEFVWADFVLARRYEYEATVESVILRRSKGDEGSYRACSQRMRDALAIFRRYGLELRVEIITGWLRELDRARVPLAGVHAVALPVGLVPVSALAVLTGAESDRGVVDVNEESTVLELRNAQARLHAIDRRLTDLKSRRDRGRIDDGRYTDLAADLDTESFQILHAVRSILVDDPDLASVLGSMQSPDGDDISRQELERVASRRDDRRLLGRLRSGGERLLSLVIDAGIDTLIRRSGL